MKSAKSAQEYTIKDSVLEMMGGASLASPHPFELQ